MIKFLLFIVQLIIILILALFIIINAFTISFELGDYIYSFSSSYLFIFILIFFTIIFIIQHLFFKSKLFFFNIKLNKKIKKKEIGYNTFVDGMIALANKDYKKALLDSKKISKNLDDKTPLSLLLRSEIYKIQKNYIQLNLIYEEMIKQKNTENLGLKGIMESYLRVEDYHHAFIYGQRLFNNNPYIEKIYDTLLSIISKTNNWQQLIEITKIAYNKKIIIKNVYQENLSIAFFEIAKIKKYNDPEESIKLILKSLDLRKNFPPYIELYTEILIDQKKFKLAKKIIKKAWEQFPFSNYRYIIENLANTANEEILEVTKFIISSSYDKEESKILLIESLIKIQQWDKARKEITILLDTKPKKNICLLMAKIEKGENNDVQKSNAWIRRAETGIASNIWICAITNISQNEWTSISNSGYFNTLEWKKPVVLQQIEDTNNLLL